MNDQVEKKKKWWLRRRQATAAREGTKADREPITKPTHHKRHRSRPSCFPVGSPSPPKRAWGESEEEEAAASALLFPLPKGSLAHLTAAAATAPLSCGQQTRPLRPPPSSPAKAAAARGVRPRPLLLPPSGPLLLPRLPLQQGPSWVSLCLPQQRSPASAKLPLTNALLAWQASLPSPSCLLAGRSSRRLCLLLALALSLSLNPPLLMVLLPLRLWSESGSEERKRNGNAWLTTEKKHTHHTFRKSHLFWNKPFSESLECVCVFF